MKLEYVFAFLMRWLLHPLRDVADPPDRSQDAVSAAIGEDALMAGLSKAGLAHDIIVIACAT
jgi:hypothetical protein